MTKTEASNFVDNLLRPLHAKWLPTTTELSAWIYLFLPFDWDVAKLAVQQAWRESNFNTPARKLILEKCRDLQQKQPAKEKLPDKEPSVFVLYRGGGRDTLRAGFFQPILFLDADWPDDDDVVKQAAERMKERLEKAHGGEWKVIQATNYGKMGRIRSDMQLSRPVIAEQETEQC